MPWSGLAMLRILIGSIRGMVTATKLMTIQKAVHIAGTLTDEAIRNGSIKKNPEKRGNEGEPRMIGMGEMITRELGMEMLLLQPQTLLVERTRRRGRNHQNQVIAVNGGQGHRNNGNQARGRAFMLGSEEARQDLYIMIGIEPSDIGFSYEIEIASGKLVEIDKVIKGCKLEIECHEFDINSIPFGSKSFNVIIGMDWLSNHKVEIICHEKVVRIPLLDGKVLRVLGERPEEKMRHLLSAKAKEHK
ncbi:putative reverse transcriptase domain-containing protein [Tanacetum coccineum]